MRRAVSQECSSAARDGRLWTVLSGKDRDLKYANLTAADRAAIVDILRDTKPDLPKTFRPLPL
jgi:hypothetical protein